MSPLVTATLPNAQNVGGRVLPPLADPERHMGILSKKTGSSLLDLCCRMPHGVAFAVEGTQPADAADGYPGVYDINGKKLAELDASADSLHNFRRGN